MARIVLASGSPRRQELLTRIGIRDFTVRVPQVEEWYPQGLTPPEIVSYISREKSQAVPSEEDEIVITADTMVFLDQQRLGKPKDEADALRMLTDLAGRRHTVCTGVTLRQGQRSLTRAQSTDVYFRPAGREELMAYIRGGEPMDKAGIFFFKRCRCKSSDRLVFRNKLIVFHQPFMFFHKFHHILCNRNCRCKPR